MFRWGKGNKEGKLYKEIKNVHSNNSPYSLELIGSSCQREVFIVYLQLINTRNATLIEVVFTLVSCCGLGHTGSKAYFSIEIQVPPEIIKK